ncbi:MULTISPECIES: NPCBM/NEW2 domain-containing protein [unclassified Roseateles]|uniref:NPCBM/NEW2 domain-containing protein n=1 Tax=unclassified Roseateles TaxID=2626991 RepID=UPI0006F6D316|nr:MULTISPECIES: NPCBM/NEW2 domain-containing protein [unclassified Roseateles]KQW48240.1 alpha-galactosidase [Pelomonas sp. Root405]KRA75391.1 alpha-galactosidase [Pelomonas sp. Root662]
MKLLALSLLVAFSAQAQQSLQATGRWQHQPVGNAATPPMGWSSWNAFRVDITEQKVLASAQVIVDSGLAAAGYRNINVDDGWWLKRRTSDGRLLVRTGLFPSADLGAGKDSSLRPFTDRIHAMGLKAGLYTDIGRNACSQAYDADSPNLPEGTHAEREVGLMGFVEQDVKLFFGEWNFDYLKVDGCGLSSYGRDRPHVASGQYREYTPTIVEGSINQSDIEGTKRLYAGLRQALHQVRPANDYMLSVCLWGTVNVRSWGQDYGTLWRSSRDIWKGFAQMVHNFDTVATREFYAGPGRWNDPDMLEIGNGDFDGNHLLEARTHLGLWAIVAAPLMIGTDLSKTSPAIIDLLKAPEVVAINQDPAGHQGVLAYADSDRQIVVKTLADGRKAVLLFNRTGANAKFTLTAEHLKMDATTPIALRDAWARADAGTFTGQREFELKPREALLFTATGKHMLPRGYFVSERPGSVYVARDGIRALEQDPVVYRALASWSTTDNGGTRPAYAGWGGPRADSTPHDQGLSVQRETFRHGIGVLADSRLQVQVAAGSQRFTARVGVDDSTRGKTAAVSFEVWGDGRRLASTAPLKFNQPARDLSADLRGVKLIELIARQHGADTTGPLVVTWGGARIE